jgi:hypothetical protein
VETPAAAVFDDEAAVAAQTESPGRRVNRRFGGPSEIKCSHQRPPYEVDVIPSPIE